MINIFNNNEEEYKRVRRFLNFIRNFRHQYCHNYHDSYRLDSLHLKKLSKEFEFYNLKFHNDIKHEFEIENFCNILNIFYDDIKKILESISYNNIVDFDDKYLFFLEHWYKENDKFLISVIADKYIMTNNSAYNITRDKVKNWIKDSSVQFSNYDAYLKKCNERVAPLLRSSKLCPKPALPLDFFHKITHDLK